MFFRFSVCDWKYLLFEFCCSIFFYYWRRYVDNLFIRTHRPTNTLTTRYAHTAFTVIFFLAQFSLFLLLIYSFFKYCVASQKLQTMKILEQLELAWICLAMVNISLNRRRLVHFVVCHHTYSPSYSIANSILINATTNLILLLPFFVSPFY